MGFKVPDSEYSSFLLKVRTFGPPTLFFGGGTLGMMGLVCWQRSKRCLFLKIFLGWDVYLFFLRNNSRRVEPRLVEKIERIEPKKMR